MKIKPISTLFFFLAKKFLGTINIYPIALIFDLFNALFFPIFSFTGTTLYSCRTSTRQWPSEFINNNHRLLQCAGFER